ncbi:MAG: phosphatase PAP2 family protein [Pseudobdellovibrio sp.]
MLNSPTISRSSLIRHTLLTGMLSVVLILIGYFRLDQAAALYFKQPELESFYRFNREITNIGYSIHYFVLAILLYVLSRFFGNKVKGLKGHPKRQLQFKEWSKFIVLNLVIIGLLGEVIKAVVGRQRPYLTEDFQNKIFDFFTTDWHFHSFPSGHTQVLFTMATIVYLIWPKQKYFIFILAAFFGFTRVAIQQHFFSDCIAGAYMGHIMTLWIYLKWPPKELN